MAICTPWTVVSRSVLMSLIITFMLEPAKLQMNWARASGTSTRPQTGRRWIDLRSDTSCTQLPSCRDIERRSDADSLGEARPGLERSDRPLLLGPAGKSEGPVWPIRGRPPDSGSAGRPRVRSGSEIGDPRFTWMSCSLLRKSGRLEDGALASAVATDRDERNHRHEGQEGDSDDDSDRADRRTAEHRRLAEATGRRKTTCSTPTRGTSGVRTCRSGRGERCGRTTATAATHGATSLMIMPGHGPTGGTRTGWPACRTSATTCVSRWRCGTGPIRSSRSACSA